MRQQRSVVMGVFVLAVFALGLAACSGGMSSSGAAAPTSSQLAGKWRGTGWVGDLNGPIELNVAPDGTFTGLAAGNPVRGTLKTAENAISLDSQGPKGGATGTMTYREVGGKQYLKVSATGKYSGQPLDFELVKQQ